MGNPGLHRLCHAGPVLWQTGDHMPRNNWSCDFAADDTMCELPDEAITLWVERAFRWLHRRLHNHLLASVFLLAVPLTVVGLIIQPLTGFTLFTRGLGVSMVWTALAPWFIHMALGVVWCLAVQTRQILPDTELQRDFWTRELERLQSPRSLWIGVPLGAGVAAALLFTLYASAPVIVKMWIVAWALGTFAAGGVGFWAMGCIVTILGRMHHLPLVLRPFHQDQFGGFKFLGEFSVKWTTLFFTGSLMFPLVFEVGRYCLRGNLAVDLLVALLVGGYILTGIVAFIWSQVLLHDLMWSLKEQCLEDSEAKLAGYCSQATDYAQGNEVQLHHALVTGVYYHIYHRRIEAIREWPWDTKVIVEFSLSVLFPVVMLLVELYIK